MLAQLVVVLCMCSVALAFGFQSTQPTRMARQLLSMKTSDGIEYGKYLAKDKPVFIAGGSSGVGFEVVKKLSAMGVPTKVLVRWPDAQAMLNTLPHVRTEKC